LSSTTKSILDFAGVSLILSFSCPATLETFEVTSLTEVVMDVALDKKDDTPDEAVVEAEVLVGDVGAEVTLVLLAPVVVGVDPTPDRDFGGSVEGGTADVGLPGNVGPPPAVLTLPAEGPAPPVKSSSPSFSPERSPWENLRLR
jgi:hypothetical protein